MRAAGIAEETRCGRDGEPWSNDVVDKLPWLMTAAANEESAMPRNHGKVASRQKGGKFPPANTATWTGSFLCVSEEANLLARVRSA